MTGKWRASWENEDGSVEHADLMPMDVISFAPGMIRRFENITEGPKDKHSVLMFIISGDGPGAEFTEEAMSEIEKAGLLETTPDVREDSWTKPRSQF